MEEWRIIKECPDYAVSSEGRVKSLSRKIFNGHSYFQSKEKILRQNTLAKGYKQVTLYNLKHRIQWQVHRLVCTEFIPNPNNYDQVNHINGIKDDNRLENLEWCNNSMNQIHAYKNGLNHHSEKAGRPKIPILLTDSNGKQVVIKSLAETMRFLHLKCTDVIRCAIKNNKTIKDYKIDYYER